MARKVILFELNEVPYGIIDDFCRREPDSFLARALPRCRQYTTEAADELQLDPWITWPTVHRGVADIDHGILHLGQDLARADEEYPPSWKIVSAAGLRAGVFGSLHSSHLPDDMAHYPFYLPDYFAGEAAAHPTKLQAFQRFNLAMTRGSARNVSRAVPLGPALALLKELPALGVRPATIRAIASQLVAEARAPDKKIRRRSLQPLLMFDVFLKLLNAEQPDYATFYSNHVAAAMHRYWAALFPGDYDEIPVDDGWVGRYESEIPHALGQFSRIFRGLARFTHRHPEYLVVVASSMGQAAIPNKRTFEFLTVTDVAAFMAGMGLVPGDWEQRFAMVPCTSVVVRPRARDTFRDRLRTLAVEGHEMVADARPLHALSFDEQEGGFFHIFVQIDSYTGPREARLGGQRFPLGGLGMGMMAHEDGVNCTAQHTPEGSLFVYDPRSRAGDSARERISTLDVLPSLLHLMEIPAPAYLRGRTTAL